jgi:hypothetical protein
MELHLGLKLEGTDADITTLKQYLTGKTQLTFPQLLALLDKLTKVTLTEQTITTKPVKDLTEKTIYTT